MQRKNDSTILILIAAGLGIYWFMKNKSNTSQVNPADNTTGGGGGAYQQPEDTLVNVDTDGGNSDMILTDPIEVGGGRGGDTFVTDMFNSINDYKLGINENYRYK